MGGGKKSKAPATPDYSALAAQQGEINKQTAQYLTEANRPDQYDAFGNSITWERQVDQAAVDRAQAELDAFMQTKEAYHGGKAKGDALKKAVADAKAGGKWIQRQNLSPEDLFNEQVRKHQEAQASSKYGTMLNNFLDYYKPYASTSGPIQYDDYTDNYEGEYDDAKDFSNALYGSIMDRARPEQARETQALSTQLRQQGLVPGSVAYDNAMKNLMTSQNDANTLASQRAILEGGAESRARNDEMRNRYQEVRNRNMEQRAQFQEQRNRAGEDRTRVAFDRNQPLQELAGMAGIASGQQYQPTYPGFSGATGYNPTDLIGAANAAYGANASKYNSSQSKKGGLLGAGAGLAGSMLGGK